jgi:signal transduction histidine kinase
LEAGAIMHDESTGNERRLLVTLQRLLAIPAADLRNALSHASDALASATRADKVDAFLYEESRDSLVAVGTSAQPLSNLQRTLGLDVLPVSNGGRVVYVYQTGETFLHGDLQNDPGEIRGIKEGLGIRSKLGVPLVVGNERRGMIMLASLQRDFFTELDAAFLTSAARWVGMVAERAELIANIERNAVEQGRRATAETLIAVLAHDVRNYLAPATMRLHHMKLSAEAQRRAADARDADAALDALGNLSALVSDLLDAARLEAGAFHVSAEPVDIVALAHDAARVMSTPDHEIAVKAYKTIVVAADPRRIRQCIDNLMANAIAHSPLHAPVSVFIDAFRESGTSWARIEVVDEGPGVAEAMLPRLFEPFASGRADRESVGLGLYIARQIALAHDGELLVDRYPGKGARFTILLPALERRD